MMNLIVGYGVTGQSVARYLHKKQQDYIIIDSRDNLPTVDEFGHKIYSGEFDLRLLNEAQRLIVSPGICVNDAPFNQVEAEIIGDIELFARELKNSKAKLVAITGSNGKSTVTDLIGKMAEKSGLKVLQGGNIGVPALDLLSEPEPDLYVLELSSFQLETTYNLECNVACVLNISPDHLDRYVDYHAYSEAKRKITSMAKNVVLFEDDEILHNWILPAGINRIGFSAKDAIPPIKMPGRHNALNALAALSAGAVIGLPQQSMRATLQEYSGLAHRTELVAEKNQVRWINDSKGTNVGATVAAIEGLAAPGKKNIILLAGGQGKGADFAQLGQAANQAVKLAILFGEDAPKIAAVMANSTTVGGLQEAVTLAASHATTSDVVLLSPACASFDMFENYQARGKKFTQLVGELI